MKKVQNARLCLEAHGAGPIRVDREDATPHVLTHGDDGARLESSTGADHRSESLGVAGLGEQVKNLGAAAAVGVTEETGGEDPAPVHDQEVPFSQKVGERRELTVPKSAGRAIKGEESRGVPFWKRRLRYEFGRQIEVEVPGLQNSFFCGRSGSGRSRPKCLYARGVAVRPRGVRSTKPICRR